MSTTDGLRQTLVICLFFASSTIAEYSCEGGWEYYNLECYLFGVDYINFQAADALCVSLGSNLTSIGDEYELEYLNFMR